MKFYKLVLSYFLFYYLLEMVVSLLQSFQLFTVIGVTDINLDLLILTVPKDKFLLCIFLCHLRLLHISNQDKSYTLYNVHPPKYNLQLINLYASNYPVFQHLHSLEREKLESCVPYNRTKSSGALLLYDCYNHCNGRLFLGDTQRMVSPFKLNKSSKRSK